MNESKAQYISHSGEGDVTESEHTTATVWQTRAVLVDEQMQAIQQLVTHARAFQLYHVRRLQGQDRARKT